MADTKETGKGAGEAGEKKANELTEVVSVCDLSIPSIIAALHQKALAAATSKVADIRVANSAIEDDGKTAKLNSAGEHIISILGKDENSKVAKDVAVTALKEYVHWFVGPDLAEKVKDDVVLPLSGGDIEDEASSAEGEESKKEPKESLKKGFPYKTFLEFLNEADDDDDSSDEETSGEEPSEENAEGEDEEASSEDEENSEESKGDEDKEEALGYYIAYNLKVQGLKETALKDAMKKFAGDFFDTLTIKADGLFGGSQSLSVKQVKDELKKAFGDIEPEKLKSTLRTKIEQKFPDLKSSLDIDVRDQNTLLADLKGKKGFDSKVKDAIMASDYSLTIVAEKSDKHKKFLNLRVVADLVTSSIQGLFKKFKNNITKDKVFLIPNFTDDNIQKADQEKVRALEIKIPKPEVLKDKISKSGKDTKALTALIVSFGKLFDAIEKDKLFNSSKKAKSIVAFWKEFYKKHNSEAEMKKTTKDDFVKFADEYEKKYKELGLGASENDSNVGESASVTFLPKHAIQKMILEMLFDEAFSLNEEGEFADLMADDSSEKKEEKDEDKGESNDDGNTKEPNLADVKDRLSQAIINLTKTVLKGKQKESWKTGEICNVAKSKEVVHHLASVGLGSEAEYEQITSAGEYAMVMVFKKPREMESGYTKGSMGLLKDPNLFNDTSAAELFKKAAGSDLTLEKQVKIEGTAKSQIKYRNTSILADCLVFVEACSAAEVKDAEDPEKPDDETPPEDDKKPTPGDDKEPEDTTPTPDPDTDPDPDVEPDKEPEQAPSGNFDEGSDLYVIPMPGLKFPDDDDE